MKQYILIKADTNDADYINSKHDISDISSEDIENIKSVVNAIKEYTNDKSIKYQKWNWWMMESSKKDRPSPTELYVDSGKCTQKALDYFDDLCPSDEFGIHSIKSVEILIVQEEIKLL